MTGRAAIWLISLNKRGRCKGAGFWACLHSWMLGLGLACLLAMSSSDEDEAIAIMRAQAAACASASAATPGAGSGKVEAPAPNESLFGQLPNEMLVASVSSGPRRTCVKEKLPIKCAHCSNRPRDREACAYKTGEWDPPSFMADSSTCSTESEPVVAGTDSTTDSAAQEHEIQRTRKQTVFLEPGEFWRRELPDVAERRDTSAAMAAELAELEGTVVAKLKAAEQELALYKHREQREAEAKRQKTLENFFEKSRGLPTRPGHFDADLSKATGYSETELRRTFRADVAAVETFIESRVSDPLKQPSHTQCQIEHLSIGRWPWAGSPNPSRACGTEVPVPGQSLKPLRD